MPEGKKVRKKELHFLELPQSKKPTVPVTANNLSSQTNYTACTFVKLCQALLFMLKIRKGHLFIDYRKLRYFYPMDSNFTI